MRKRCPGWTMLEMIIVAGVIVVLASVLFPIASSLRAKAKKTQCAGNLLLLHQALTMYSVDNTRDFEVYPKYLTNLCFFSERGASSEVNGSYVDDERVFVCPMDNTKATRNVYGVTALKPIYTTSPPVPKDNKAEWAERRTYGNGMLDCSYLYEFSGRPCQTYDPDDWGGTWREDSPSSFAEWYLTDPVDAYFTTTPYQVVREGIPMADGSIVVTWQDAKFYQQLYGDIYRLGVGFPPDDYPEPPAGFLAAGFFDPGDYYWEYDIAEEDYLHSYPRTWMPIIRCFWHQTPMYIDSESYEEVQNMSLAGNVFNSAPYWERTAFKYGSKVGGDE